MQYTPQLVEPDFQATESRVIPPAVPLAIDSKSIVVIHTKEFPIKPVSIRGRCFRRVSASNRIMPPQEIAQVHLFSTGTSLDAFGFTRATLNDINWEKGRRYIRQANATGRRKIPSADDPQRVLEKLELVKDGQPTFAAMLLFGRAPQQKLSQATVHCGRFRQETIIIDDNNPSCYLRTVMPFSLGAGHQVLGAGRLRFS